jgi:hypothetical protein
MVMKEDDYIKVSDGFYDALEERLIAQKTCEIVFLNNGSRSVIRGKIEDLEDRADGQFAILASGLEIRLDRFLAVDGISSPNYLV